MMEDGRWKMEEAYDGRWKMEEVAMRMGRIALTC